MITKVHGAKGQTHPMFWDCNCNSNYIHPKSEKECPICHANSDESPDSRLDEIVALGKLPEATVIVTRRIGYIVDSQQVGEIGTIFELGFDNQIWTECYFESEIVIKGGE